MLHGLTKNAFASQGYSVALTLASTVSLLGLCVWPFVGPLFVPGASRWLLVAAAGVGLVPYGDYASSRRVPLWYALAFPLAALAMLYASWRSLFVTLGRRGITWRGTLYPLADLKHGGHEAWAAARPRENPESDPTGPR